MPSADRTGPPGDTTCSRLHVAIRGAVQGVGFRPFVFALASELRLAGWVANSAQGVLIEVEGPRAQLEAFALRLGTEHPAHAVIQSRQQAWLDPAGHRSFAIRESDDKGAKTAFVLPDIATCADCLREVLDPRDRRHRYPFTNCTNCGPRYSIILELPYDRPHTTMGGFALCARCRAEYENPADRRFHAQPTACADCGPRLALWNPAGAALVAGDAALAAAVAALRRGEIVAAKGLGGFHLMVDARDDDAVLRLRRRKRREEKPLALMAPDLEAVAACCELAPAEQQLLCSPAAPIVLLRRRGGAPSPLVADAVAPENPELGMMLPYTPLHHLLLAALGRPLVATSGNLGGEPICTDELEALERLGAVADLFLVHDRPIARHVDDSVARLVAGRPMLLRRARGYAPLPLQLDTAAAPPLIAVGPQQKSTVALLVGQQCFVSQHIGDLESTPACATFEKVVDDLTRLYGTTPDRAVCDPHPDYHATSWAERAFAGEGRLLRVQHHLAHVLACMADNELSGEVLGVAWDGTGLGDDGTVWGGEFLAVDGPGAARRVAHLRPFPLPGGDAAAREPRRAALGLLFAAEGETLWQRPNLAPLDAFEASELRLLRQALGRGINSPPCSSVGRLFDAVAALLGLHQRVSFEGQAAMALEFLLDEGATAESCYSLAVVERCSQPLLLDWRPLLDDLLADLAGDTSRPLIAARFHNGLAAAVVQVARRLGRQRVVLSGGCWQNRYLSERTIDLLRRDGLTPYWHQRLPPNDGGIAVGQALAARREDN